jgi:hypothetical protein
MKKQIIALATLSIAVCSFASTGQLTLSGSTWTGKVDGTTVYTGTSMSGCGNTIVSKMSSGTINQLNSGTMDGHTSLKSSLSWAGASHTMGGGDSTGTIYASGGSSINCTSVHFSSTGSFGVRFRTVNGQSTSGSWGTSGICFRIDDCGGGPGYNWTAGSPSSDTSGAHGDNFCETYGISGNSVGTVTATDRGACGLLYNFSSSASTSSVNGTRCNYGGGFAAFRTANSNTSTTCGTDTANSCGRGYFSVSGSGHCTVSTVNANNCSSHGVWLQTANNTHVNGGTVVNCHPCSAISSDGGGNSISVTCK